MGRYIRAFKFFWRGANATGAAATLVLGTACGVGLFVANVPLHLLHLHFLYVAPLLLALDTAILILVSRWSAAPVSAATAQLIWTPAHYREETERLRPVALWRSYRAQALALLILTALIVVVFR